MGTTSPWSSVPLLFYHLGAESWACRVPVAAHFPRAGLSFLDPFNLLFPPDLEQGHPEVLLLCPSQPSALTLRTLTLACTEMEFATPSWASCFRPLALLPFPCSVSQGSKLFLLPSQPAIPLWKLPGWYPARHTQEATRTAGTGRDIRSELTSGSPAFKSPLSSLKSLPA